MSSTSTVATSARSDKADCDSDAYALGIVFQSTHVVVCLPPRCPTVHGLGRHGWITCSSWGGPHAFLMAPVSVRTDGLRRSAGLLHSSSCSLRQSPASLLVQLNADPGPVRHKFPRLRPGVRVPSPFPDVCLATCVGFVY